MFTHPAGVTKIRAGTDLHRASHASAHYVLSHYSLILLLATSVVARRLSELKALGACVWSLRLAATSNHGCHATGVRALFPRLCVVLCESKSLG